MSDEPPAEGEQPEHPTEPPELGARSGAGEPRNTGERGEAGAAGGAESVEELNSRLARIEQLLSGRHAARFVGERVVTPVWRESTEGESRVAISIALLAAIVLQLLLAERFTIRPFWFLPALEAVLGIALWVANPGRITEASRLLRTGGIVLIGIVSVANAWAAVKLIRALVEGTATKSAATLLATGGSIWLTNVIVFAMWYWELDRGGPAARAQGQRRYPDFQFPQMDNPELTPPGWAPNFIDYFYLSFTNATAFSPTDVMPLARWAKLTMLLQSAVSLATVALVVARAVNILR